MVYHKKTQENLKKHSINDLYMHPGSINAGDEQNRFVNNGLSQSTWLSSLSHFLDGAEEYKQLVASYCKFFIEKQPVLTAYLTAF